MKPEIKTLWLAALRSGQYEQGTGALRNVVAAPNGELGYEYCCLGVLCNVFHETTGEGDWDEEENYFVISAEDRNRVVPPRRVQDWAGLSQVNPTIKNDSLAEANDGGASFSEIANIIEAEL